MKQVDILKSLEKLTLQFKLLLDVKKIFMIHLPIPSVTVFFSANLY